MALRPIFIPNIKGEPVIIKMIEFQWHPGFSKKQKQMNIKELHKNAKELGFFPLLEISTKSNNELGEKLSAFNLKYSLTGNNNIPVEAAFQSSKVFQFGGPYRDMLSLTGKQIKKDERLINSGRLIYFLFENIYWDLEPKNAFYDWLYIKALMQNYKLSKKLISYKGFTDIEFNPRKQINCQAHAAALYVSLNRRGILDDVMKTKSTYLTFLYETYKLKKNIQSDLFGVQDIEKESKIIEILSKLTEEFVSKHWNKKKLEKYNVPRWIKITNYHEENIRNKYGCFVLGKNGSIRLLGQPYIKHKSKKEVLHSFGEIMDNFLFSKNKKNHIWNDFDEIYVLPIDKDIIYLSKSIKEFLIAKGL